MRTATGGGVGGAVGQQQLSGRLKTILTFGRSAAFVFGVDIATNRHHEQQQQQHHRHHQHHQDHQDHPLSVVWYLLLLLATFAQCCRAYEFDIVIALLAVQLVGWAVGLLVLALTRANMKRSTF
ncbi:hypothetical protein ACLKA6_004285 [Drosophila palustris]